MSASRVVLFLAVAAAAIAPPVGFATVMFFGGDPVAVGDVSAITVFFSLVFIMLSPFFSKGESGEKIRSMCYIWMWASGITHLTWELGWCLVHPYLHDLPRTGAEGLPADQTWAWLFWIYGIADQRYLFSDPFIVIMEWVTSVGGGPINLYVIYLLAKKREKDALGWILFVSTMELYGTVLYFGTEAVNGFMYVDTQGFVNLWFKFVGLNCIWIAFPALAIWTALRDLREWRMVPGAASAPSRGEPEQLASG